MSRAWDGGSTSAWRKVRARVLLANQAENAGLCRLNVGKLCPRHDRKCVNVCTSLAREVHHMKGKAYGDDPRYLVAVCRACNLHVGEIGTVNPQPVPRSKW